MNPEQTNSYVENFWQKDILPTLSRYIEIPNQSPLFEPDWKEKGHMDRAVTLVKEWILAQNIPNSTLKVLQLENRTPLLLLEVEGKKDGTILLYGHLDKQPPMIGWDPDLDPWKPVFRDGKLYGRGGADDGYAAFAVVAAIKALQEQNIDHPRLVTIIECCEESGSVDLPYYVNAYEKEIGTPGLVICLDSGCGNYEQLWTTTSLRGVLVGELTAEVLSEGVHSGDASGIVPSSFRVLRQLLDRLEDAKTGKILPPWLWVDIPEDRIKEARKTAAVLQNEVYSKFPFVNGTKPVSDDLVELILNRTWRPALSYTGQDGLPGLGQAGNVLRPKTSLKLSLRLPPTLSSEEIEPKLQHLLESDPPSGAKVSFVSEKGAAGWNAPSFASWLEKSVDQASMHFFGKGLCYNGEGGSIPFMGMLGEKFPNAQFLITGVLGPHSNAHGPNEFLHIQTAKNITSIVSHVIADFSGTG